MAIAAPMWWLGLPVSAQISFCNFAASRRCGKERAVRAIVTARSVAAEGDLAAAPRTDGNGPAVAREVDGHGARVGRRRGPQPGRLDVGELDVSRREQPLRAGGGHEAP